jgi:flagellar biosynthesis protein FliQ
MPHFAIRENGFDAIKKKVLVRTLVVMIAAMTVGLTISTLNAKHEKDDVNILPYFIPLMAVFIAYRMYSGTKKLKTSFESFTLNIADNVITREQNNLNPLSISAIEIKEIVKNKDGTIVIKGLTASDMICVPAQINDPEGLEILLNSLHPVTVKNKDSFLRKYSFLLAFVMMGLMLGVYAATNKIIVTVCGVLLIGLLGWGIYNVQQNKNVDVKVKRSSWWVAILLLSVIGVMILKLSA